jgi:hypothetical protein
MTPRTHSCRWNLSISRNEGGFRREHPHSFRDVILRCEAFLAIPFFRRNVRSSETYDNGFLAKGLFIDTPYIRKFENVFG